MFYIYALYECKGIMKGSEEIKNGVGYLKIIKAALSVLQIRKCRI